MGSPPSCPFDDPPAQRSREGVSGARAFGIEGTPGGASNGSPPMACAHRGCKCVEAPVRRGELTYCSEVCASLQSGGKHQATCPCGHKECAAPKKPPK